MRLAGQLLADVDHLRLRPRVEDSHRAVMGIDDPHQGDAGGQVVELSPQPPILALQRTVWYENKSLVLPGKQVTVTVGVGALGAVSAEYRTPRLQDVPTPTTSGPSIWTRMFDSQITAIVLAPP